MSAACDGVVGQGCHGVTTRTAEDHPVWVDGTTPSSRGYSNYVGGTPALGSGVFFGRSNGEYEEDCWVMDGGAAHAWGHARK